eukprot:scaffold5207_cov96-Skeletonema_dohrnii-CCMP3373.AAC.8
MSRSSQLAAASALLFITALSSIQVAVGFSHVGINNSPSLHKRDCDARYTSTCCGAASIEERRTLSWTTRSNNYCSRYGAALKSNANDAAEKTGDELTEEEIDESIEYLANLIKAHLDSRKRSNEDDSSEIDGESLEDSNSEDGIGYQLAKGRFIDLTTTLEGEHLLERLFDTTHNPSPQSIDNTTVTTTPTTPNKRIIQHAITTLQSLLIYGIQIGVKGSEEAQQKMVRHLFRAGDAPQPPSGTWIPDWNADCIRRLKFFRDVWLGKMLLAKLIRKRTAQGAFDLLVDMGVWDRHVDTALLRSGFPVRFLESELEISKEAERNEHDPDAVLGIRRDLREQKVYTVDSASTLDIDDGIAVEVLGDDSDGGGEARHRYWIHIADVDRYAPRGSKLLNVAERRGTSLYLPTMTLCMFPPK